MSSFRISDILIIRSGNCHRKLFPVKYMVRHFYVLFIDHIDIKFFAKHSGSTGVLEDNVSLNDFPINSSFGFIQRNIFFQNESPSREIFT